MIESSKLKKIVLVAIVIIILIGVYFLFIAPMLENDTIPKCDVVIEYTGKSGPYSDDMGYVGLTKNVEEIRDKVGEDSNYIYYNDKGTYSNYTMEGHFSLNLTEFVTYLSISFKDSLLILLRLQISATSSIKALYALSFTAYG